MHVAADLRQDRERPEDGLDVAHGILCGVLLGLAFWAGVILLAMIVQAVIL